MAVAEHFPLNCIHGRPPLVFMVGPHERVGQLVIYSLGLGEGRVQEFEALEPQVEEAADFLTQHVLRGPVRRAVAMAALGVLLFALLRLLQWVTALFDIILPRAQGYLALLPRALVILAIRAFAAVGSVLTPIIAFGFAPLAAVLCGFAVGSGILCCRGLALGLRRVPSRERRRLVNVVRYRRGGLGRCMRG